MRTIFKISLATFLWLLVITQGNLGSLDTAVRLQMSHAWWTNTEEVAANYKPVFKGDMWAGVQGVKGKRYLFYEPGQSILMIPGDWLGTQLHIFFPNVGKKDLRNLVVSLCFIPLNVAAVVACYWLLRLFNFKEQIAGLSSIIWMLSTTFFHYAQVHFQNNQVLLFVTIGYAAALAFVKQEKSKYAIISGLALGAALLIRTTSIIHLLTVVTFFLGCVAYQSRNLSKVIYSFGFWILGFVPLVLLGRLFDYIRYGSFWVTGGIGLSRHDEVKCSTMLQIQVTTIPTRRLLWKP